jgi:hypothetical protein
MTVPAPDKPLPLKPSNLGALLRRTAAAIETPDDLHVDGTYGGFGSTPVS